MELLTRFGALDAVLLGILVLGGFIGFLQGVMRQVFLLGAVYFGMVLAAQYYGVAAAGLTAIVPGGDPMAYSAVALLLLFVVSATAINAAGYFTYKSTQRPELALTDHLGGASLGLLSAWLCLSLILSAADFALAMPLGGMGWAQHTAVGMVRSSALVPMVHGSMPALYETLRPWVPAGLPAPFAT